MCTIKTVIEQIKYETKNKRKTKPGRTVHTKHQLSKYNCFVTFDFLFVDTGYEIATRAYSGYDVKFKYVI